MPAAWIPPPIIWSRLGGVLDIMPRSKFPSTTWLHENVILVSFISRFSVPHWWKLVKAPVIMRTRGSLYRPLAPFLSIDSSVSSSYKQQSQSTACLLSFDKTPSFLLEPLVRILDPSCAIQPLPSSSEAGLVNLILADPSILLSAASLQS